VLDKNKKLNTDWYLQFNSLPNEYFLIGTLGINIVLLGKALFY